MHLELALNKFETIHSSPVFMGIGAKFAVGKVSRYVDRGRLVRSRLDTEKAAAEDGPRECDRLTTSTAITPPLLSLPLQLLLVLATPLHKRLATSLALLLWLSSYSATGDTTTATSNNTTTAALTTTTTGTSQLASTTYTD